VNIDINPDVEPDIVWDIRDGLPFEDDSIDSILAYDVLEHLNHEDTIPIWNEIHRVMKNGKRVYVKTPYPLSEFFFADPTHKVGYTVLTFDRLSHPESHPTLLQSGYKGKFVIRHCNRNEGDHNLYTILEVIK
jgi:predicted SAM-dependent methyltransferase